MTEAIVAPGGEYTKEDLEYAAEDARSITAESSVVQALVTSLILSRRLYMVLRESLDQELTHGWEVENPGLVIQTLVLASQEKANDKFTLGELYRDLCQATIPTIGIMTHQELNHDDGSEDDGGEWEEILPGDSETAEG